MPSDGLDLSPCLEVSPLAKRWARQSLSRYDLPVHESFSGPRRRARARPDAETPVRIRAVATLATCSSRGRQVVVAEEVTGRVPDLWPCNRSALRPATWLSPLPQTSARIDTATRENPVTAGQPRTLPVIIGEGSGAWRVAVKRALTSKNALPREGRGLCAPGRTRTCGQALRRRLLYPLSYGGRMWWPRTCSPRGGRSVTLPGTRIGLAGVLVPVASPPWHDVEVR